MLTKASDGRGPAVWTVLASGERRFTVLSLGIAVIQFALFDIYFRFQQLSAINSYLSGGTSGVPGDGITYLPLIASWTVYGALVTIPVVLANTRAKSDRRPELLLGSAWILASVALTFDYLIDSFEPKFAIAAVFLVVGVRYWKGTTDSSTAFIMAPLVTVIAAGDGLGHISGLFCSASGLDACSAKAVSDTYLVIMLLVLTYFTVAYRDRRPSRLLILATLLIPVAVFAALSVVP